MKAIAKHDCSATLTTSLGCISFVRMEFKKGDVITYPVFKEKELLGSVASVLGEKSVVFKIPNDFYLLVTYAKDFEYVT